LLPHLYLLEIQVVTNGMMKGAYLV
jgi:hypothetical protein